MNILIALIPALGWGLMPLVASKTGGKPANQIFGTGLGATIVGVLVLLVARPSLDIRTFLFALFCGAFWTIGQIGQFVSFRSIGVAKTMPISTGLQLVGNSLVGVMIFGDWPGASARIIGFVALLIVVLGVVLTSVNDQNDDTDRVALQNLVFLVVTTVGYWLYSAFPQIVPHADGQALFFPQMLGILLGAMIYALASGQVQIFAEKESWLGAVAGLFFGVAALAYIFSARENGVAPAFIYTQLSVVLATLGGVLFLKEKKTRREMVFTLLGLGLIVAGSVMTSFA